VLLARFRDDTEKSERGSRQAPPFTFRDDVFESVLYRGLVMMAVTPASGIGVLVVVAIMRGGLVGCLSLGGTRTIL
jgi:hypothetical protein